MDTRRSSSKTNYFELIGIKGFFLCFMLCISGFYTSSQAQSTLEYVSGTDKLVVYSDIPNLTETVTRMNGDTQDIRVKSDKYIIKVRSAATNGNWVQVFAHYTYNRALEIAPLVRAEQQTVHSTNRQNYPNFTAGWSHTYGNFEMSENQPVEVEISAVAGFQIENENFLRAKVHPANKVGPVSVLNNKIYFTISNPAQVVIDVNGQMDEHNALLNPLGAPVHALSLFANPVITKPSLANPRTFYVENGVMPTVSPSSYDMLYFMPGVHNIGQNNKIYPGKSYYIPGDAVVFGTFNNVEVPAGNFQTSGDRIKFFGYGTISGARIRHPDYVSTTENELFYRSVVIESGKNYEVSGITITDPANFSLFTPSGENGYVLWAKVVAWRANGDGLAGNDYVNDCFMRTSDDSSYTRGNRNRCTFWKDHISAIFYMSLIHDKPIVIENCDIIYCRSRDSNGHNGGAFNARGDGSPAGQQNKVNVILRNIKVHDPLSNMAIFNMTSFVGNVAAPTTIGCSYDGILFQNIQIVNPSSVVKQRLLGCAAAPFNGGIIFDNITFGQTLLTPENHTTYFTTNEFVNNIWYRMPNYYTVTTNADPAQGAVAVSTTNTTRFATRIADNGFMENSTVILKATPTLGYKFDKWTDSTSGSIISNENPVSIQMTSNKTVTANFTFVGTRTLTVLASPNGTVARSNASTVVTNGETVMITAKPAVGFRFNGWTGDVTAQNINTSIVMNADKTVSASFVRTNDFGINYGGDQYISRDGSVYAMTTVGVASTNAILGTDDDPLYQTRRAGSDFSVGYTVDNGQYEVTLKFAETTNDAAGLRLFSTVIEGTTVLTDFDIFAEAGGRFRAIDKTFQTTVSDGVLSIRFFSSIDSAVINAIKITRKSGTIPSFNPVSQYCYGAIMTALPLTSTNNIVGSWSPALNNLETTTYRFTPNTGQNALSATLTIDIGCYTKWNGLAWNNGAPTANIKAVIEGNYAQAENISAASLDVIGNAIATIPAGNNLTIQGKVNVSSAAKLIFENNSNLIQVDDVENIGSISYKRNTSIKRLDYSYWSSPVADQNLLQFTPSTLLNRFYTFYEPTNTFVQVASPASTCFTAAKGYSVRAPNNFTTTRQTFNGVFKGVPNNGTFAVPVTITTGQGIGYNLLGNPYPSTVSATAFLNANQGSLYFWTHQSQYNGLTLTNGGVSNYATFNLTGGVAATVLDGLNVTPNGFIQAGQGFMFLTSSNKNVIFTNAMRSVNNADQFFRITNTAKNDGFWLNLTNDNGAFGQIMIAYLPNTTTGFDDAYDALQINKTSNVLSSKINNSDYAIQSRGNFNSLDVVKLNLKISTPGIYTLSKDKSGGIFSNAQNLFLKDNMLGTVHNLKESKYDFVTEAGAFDNRFEIVYQLPLANPSNLVESPNVIIFKRNSMINVASHQTISSIKVIDVLGRIIFEKSDIDNKLVVLQNLPEWQQVLIVEIKLTNNEVVLKKVVY